MRSKLIDISEEHPMKTELLLLSVGLGVVLTVHLAMNGMVGAAINNPRVGNALFWCIGAAMAAIIGVSGWEGGALSRLSQVNPILLTAGAMGASLVFGIAYLIPRVGAGPFTYALLAGQIISAMVLSHYGWLGSPKQPITPMGLLGVVVMVIGIVLTRR
jgi:bacterial/archaeal transporter family-2 protein